MKVFTAEWLPDARVDCGMTVTRTKYWNSLEYFGHDHGVKKDDLGGA